MRYPSGALVIKTSIGGCKIAGKQDKKRKCHIPTEDEIIQKRKDPVFIAQLIDDFDIIVENLDFDNPDCSGFGIAYFIAESFCKYTIVLKENGKQDKKTELNDEQTRIIEKALYLCRLSVYNTYYKEQQFGNSVDYYWYAVNTHILYAEILGILRRYYESIDVLRMARSFFKTYNTITNHDSSDVIRLEERLELEEIRMAYDGMRNNGPMATLYLSHYIIKWKDLLVSEIRNKDIRDVLTKSLSGLEDISKVINDRDNPLPPLFKEEFEQPTDKEEYTYRKFCWDNNLFLSSFNSVYPYYYLVGKHPYNMMRECIDLEDYAEECKILMADIMLSYCHSRYLWYLNINGIDSDKNYPVERIVDPRIIGFRTVSTEPLIDCFTRCYSVLDKVAKVVQYEFGIEIYDKKGEKTYAYYSNLTYTIRKSKELSSNPFLMNLVSLYREISPPDNYKRDYAMWPDFEKINSIRNHIMHSGFAIVDEDFKKTTSKSDLIAYLSLIELQIQTERLLFIVKNAIMYSDSAIRMNRRNQDKLNKVKTKST